VPAPSHCLLLFDGHEVVLPLAAQASLSTQLSSWRDRESHTPGTAIG
jgi:hypothetical protein